jgi:hypothetical protein
MDMMSVSDRFATPLRVEKSYREGRQPKILAGLHVRPMPVEGISSPHQHPSAATCVFPKLPNVKNTTVEPSALTFTPLGSTLIWADTTAAVAKQSVITKKIFFTVLVPAFGYPQIQF